MLNSFHAIWLKAHGKPPPALSPAARAQIALELLCQPVYDENGYPTGKTICLLVDKDIIKLLEDL